MRGLLAVLLVLTIADRAQAQLESKISRIRTYPYPSPSNLLAQERLETIKQLAGTLETLRARAAQGQSTGDEEATKRKGQLEDAIRQLEQYHTAALANQSLTPAVFTTLHPGTLGRPRVALAQIMQLVDERSVLVKGTFVDGQEQVVLVRGVKTDSLVDQIELKQIFRVSGKHKYKAGGKEVEAPILEVFQAAEFAAK